MDAVREEATHFVLGVARFDLWISGALACRDALPSQGSLITIKPDERRYDSPAAFGRGEELPGRIAA